MFFYLERGLWFYVYIALVQFIKCDQKIENKVLSYVTKNNVTIAAVIIMTDLYINVYLFVYCSLL